MALLVLVPWPMPLLYIYTIIGGIVLCCVEVVAVTEGGYCWHEALCQPNPSRSAYTPGGGGRQPGAALRIVETQYMQMSACMSATLAVPCDKVIYKQSAQTARRATWCIYRRGDAPLGMVVCTISRAFVLEKER